MQHVVFVRVLHCIADLRRIVERAHHLERATLDDDRLQRIARDVLHDDEKHVVLFFRRDHGDDVRMPERREQARLFQEFAEVQILAMGHLECHPFVDPGVFRQVDGGESATPEGLDDLVLAERLAAKHHFRGSEYHRAVCNSAIEDGSAWKLRVED